MSKKIINQSIAVSLLSVVTGASSAADSAGDTVRLDDYAVTATKDSRPTQQISQGVSVINQQTIDDWNVLNVQDALKHMPGVVTKTTSGGYSARIAIRGAGIKAPFGVREISVLRDGVPVTDPDGFSRLDFIDPQDIAQVEVVKGPGSIYSYGSSGGTIQILSRSVFDPGSDRVRVGGGAYDSNTQNVRYSGNITENDFYALTWSRQDNSNSWRENNDYVRNNGSVKYGHLFDDESKFEMEIAYTNSNLQLPQDYLQDEYNEWESGSDARWNLDDGYPYRHRARDSQVVFFNTSYEKSYGDITIKPRFYVNYWDHFHPTSGVGFVDKQIVIGGDFQLDWNHTLFDREAKMIIGAIGRNDAGRSHTNDYADREESGGFFNRLVRTLSERPGELQSYGQEDNFDFGGYIQYTFQPIEKLTTDMSFRYDRIMMNISRNELHQFDFSRRLFSTSPGRGITNIDAEYDIFSSRFGLTYQWMDELNTYFNFSYGDQVPGASEVRSNLLSNRSGELQPSSTYNYEVGLKFRNEYASLDVAFYYAKVLNEILSGKDELDETYYVNAGSSEKLGIEVAAEVYVPYVEGLSLGVNYTWNDHVISEWTLEDASTGTSTIYDGNTFGKIPRHMYSLFANYQHQSGLSASVRSRIQSKYWKNNENLATQDGNSAIYGGLNFITDATVSYTYKGHTIQGNMDNVFDKHYAADANINSVGERFESERYKLASPRTYMVTYQYNF